MAESDERASGSIGRCQVDDGSKIEDRGPSHDRGHARQIGFTKNAPFGHDDQKIRVGTCAQQVRLFDGRISDSNGVMCAYRYLASLQSLDDLESWGTSDVVRVCLECKPPNRDARFGDTGEHVDDAPDHVVEVVTVAFGRTLDDW